MTALEWAEKYVYFAKSSPVTGPFLLKKYPFLKRPLESLDDISKKQTVVYKASSALGTVFLQIATGFRLDRRPGDMLLVAQSDDDAGDWSKTRIRPFIQSLEPLMSMLKNDKNAITNDLMQWPHQFVIISGPGLNSQNSKQVRYVHSDEAHLYKAGALAAFDKRMGGRWDRASLDVSTAADEGADVDLRYYEGRQNEWHHRCSCGELIWLLWREAAKKHYGQEVFRWRECEHEADTLQTIHVVCPRCGKPHEDTPRARFALLSDGDYIAMNPNAQPKNESFRWNVFAAHWISWGDILSEHFQAMRAARIGDLTKHADFVKKRECRSYVAEIPDLGESVAGRDYKLDEIWDEEPVIRIGAIDVQDEGGLHFWLQIDDFAVDGSSRRVFYGRVSTWEQCKAIMEKHEVNPHNVFVDAGDRTREVFARCSEWQWYALFSSDDQSFVHLITIANDQPKQPISRPYSMTRMEDSMKGKRRLEIVRGSAGGLPQGFCYSRLWSKPVIAGILSHLKSGTSGRYYGIATDISADFVSQIHSYVCGKKRDKTTNAVKIYWRQVKKDDHAFSTASMCIIGAMVAGFFPMDFATPDVTEESVELITEIP